MQACPLPEGAGRRLRAVSLVNGQAFEMPITQAELGDATGLSTVHVNRTLQELRGDGLITTPKNGRVVIEDWDGLQKAGEFDPTYLHIKKQAAWPSGEIEAGLASIDVSGRDPEWREEWAELIETIRRAARWSGGEIEPVAEHSIHGHCGDKPGQ
jgi:biotin operon repressor